jgi:hypothetical protein
MSGWRVRAGARRAEYKWTSMSDGTVSAKGECSATAQLSRRVGWCWPFIAPAGSGVGACASAFEDHPALPITARRSQMLVWRQHSLSPMRQSASLFLSGLPQRVPR